MPPCCRCHGKLDAAFDADGYFRFSRFLHGAALFRRRLRRFSLFAIFCFFLSSIFFFFATTPTYVMHTPPLLSPPLFIVGGMPLTLITYVCYIRRYEYVVITPRRPHTSLPRGDAMLAAFH